MSWTHRTTMLVLTIVTALPVSGTVCAMVCDAAAITPASHHGSGMSCQHAASPSTAAQLHDVTNHDCGTHDTTMQQATTAAERADLSAVSAPLAVVTPHAAIDASPSQFAFNDSAPSGHAPPGTAPLVLRV